MSQNQGLVGATTPGSGAWGEGPYGQETCLVHAGVAPDPTTGAILTPVVVSTTFVQESIENYLEKGFSYTRSGNPTVKVLEDKIAALEGAAFGACFATGMAATTTALLGLMSTGDHCVITNCSYGGTNRACRVFLTRLGMTFDFVDMTDLKAVEAAIKPNTKVIFAETPANPTLTLIDLPGLAKLAKSKGITTICDSTFATPIIQQPVTLGIDIVLHSTTKYFDGHNMTVGGALATSDKDLFDKIKLQQNILGNIMTPQVAFLQLQATKTLGLRIRKQSENAQLIAEFLESHPKVDTVRYPGLKSHPQKALADAQHKNGVHGNMLWFEVKGGTEAGRKLMNTVERPWSLCENLGATESIITAPAVMTHANMLKEDRLKVGITDGFVRISCGLEDSADLIKALKKGLDAL